MEWVKSGRNYFIEGHKEQVTGLPVAVYKLNQSMVGFYLNRQFDQFNFDYKVYNMDKKFIEHVVRQYKSSKGNLGVLLNGLKGTGKTVTAKLICNELKLPVIIVPQNYEGLVSFINSIQEDVIFFFDEYEKMFVDRNDSTILTVMDGVLDNGFRRMWLLTTNNRYVNDNMLERPSRIRYIKNYTDLPLETIHEIVDDKLLKVEFREEVIHFISQLNLITVDLIKSIIDEVNIHNLPPEEFRDIFNANARDNSFTVHEVYPANLYPPAPVKEGETPKVRKPRKPNLLWDEVKISPMKITKQSIGQDFLVNDSPLGVIHEVVRENTVILNMGKGKGDEIVRRAFKFENNNNYHRYFRHYDPDFAY